MSVETKQVDTAPERENRSSAVVHANTGVIVAATVTAILSVAGTLIVSAVLNLFENSENLTRVTQRLDGLQDEVSKLQQEQVSVVAVENELNTSRNNLSNLDTRVQTELTNLKNKVESSVVNLQNKVDSLEEMAAQLRAISATQCSMPETVAKMRERLASIEARQNHANSAE